MTHLQNMILVVSFINIWAECSLFSSIISILILLKIRIVPWFECRFARRNSSVFWPWFTHDILNFTFHLCSIFWLSFRLKSRLAWAFQRYQKNCVFTWHDKILPFNFPLSMFASIVCFFYVFFLLFLLCCHRLSPFIFVHRWLLDCVNWRVECIQWLNDILSFARLSPLRVMDLHAFGHIPQPLCPVLRYCFNFVIHIS